MGSLPEISLGTAALVIFALCAGYMFLKGLVRTIVNTLLLLVSAWVGFQVWQMAPSLAIDWFGQPSELVATGLPFLAFLVTFFVLRKIIKLFSSPIQAIGGATEGSPGRLVFRLLIIVVLASLLCITGATLVHHAGSVSELRDSVGSGTGPPPDPGFAQRLKESISGAIPDSLMEMLDPLAAQPRLQLAKMIAAGQDPAAEPVIDPETGQPYPRAEIVEDPELVELAREGRFSTLLRHPLISQALEDPRIRESLGL